MKVILCMAISVDGYIAKKNGDSDWVSELDVENFKQKIKETGVVGRKTFDQYQSDIYPIEGVVDIVLCSDKKLKFYANNIIHVDSPIKAVVAVQKNGHNDILLIGSGIINGVFLRENLISEAY